MNHQQVPVFEMDGEDYSTPANRPGKSIMSEDDDVMELVWQDGKVVMLNQSAQNRKPQPKYDVGLPEDIIPAAPPPESHQPPQIFMHENEMATWLNYPFPENVFGSDFLYSNSNPPPSTAKSSAATSVVMETITVVDSNDTPLVGPGSSSGSKTDSKLDSTNASSFTAVSVSGFDGGGGVLSASISASERELTCETASLTSSTGGGGSTTSASGSHSAEAVRGPVDRKRKAAECQSEEVEFESGSSVKKEAGGSSSSHRSVRSRAAEVHNLSERKRRYRINEKMKSLRVMVPLCNKADKASMLDEAIEYVKTLQSQVQVMSLGGCGMVPTMFPGAHPYMPMGMAQMGTGIGMGMNRPMMPIMPYGNVLAGTPMPTPGMPTMGPRFPVPAYQMPTMPPDDPNAAQATGHSDQTSISDLLGTDSQSQSLGPSSSDPYQQYPTSQQNQAMAQPSSSEPSFSKGPQNRESQK